MSCRNHTATQGWCRDCAPSAAVDPAAGEVIAVRVIGEQTWYAVPSTAPSADARIAWLEANVNEKVARIRALESEIAALHATDRAQISAAREAALLGHIRSLLAILRQQGGYTTPEQQRIMTDARAEVAR